MNNAYFITGATGAVGSALVPYCLHEESSRIILLIRANSDEHLEIRLQELFLLWNILKADEGRLRHRIIPLRGDTCVENFGLPEEKYQFLVKEVTHIVHCAGVVRMNYPIEKARMHAIEPANNIVKLAEKALEHKLKKIDFISTVGVLGTLPGALSENWCKESRSFHNTYEQAKAEAENFFEERVPKSRLPLTLIRPSMVVGNSETGKIPHFQVFYHFAEFLTGRKTYGFQPDFRNMRLDTIPSDLVAEVIYWSMHNPETQGKIIHACSSKNGSFNLEELQIILRDEFIKHGVECPKLHVIPTGLFLVLIRILEFISLGKSRRSMRALRFILQYLGKEQSFENTTMQTGRNDLVKKLEEKEYIYQVIRYYLKMQYGN